MCSPTDFIFIKIELAHRFYLNNSITNIQLSFTASIRRLRSIAACCELSLFLETRFSYYLFYLGFHSQKFMIHRTASKGRGHFFDSSLPLPLASQAHRHSPDDYCRQLTYAQVATGLEPGAFSFRDQVINH